MRRKSPTGGGLFNSPILRINVGGRSAILTQLMVKLLLDWIDCTKYLIQEEYILDATEDGQESLIGVLREEPHPEINSMLLSQRW